MKELLERLITELKGLNANNLKYEISDYNEYTHPSWLNIRGVGVPMKNSLKLPKGAEWISDNRIIYQGREIHIVPLP